MNKYYLSAKERGLRAVAIENMLEYDLIHFLQYERLSQSEFDNVYSGYLAQLELLFSGELLNDEIRLSSVDCIPDFEYMYGDRKLTGMQAYYARKLVKDRD